MLMFSGVVTISGLVLLFNVAPAVAQARVPAPDAVAVAAAQETGWIEGIVLDQATRRPVPMAVIIMDATGASAVGGADGRFKIQKVPVGGLTLRIEAHGYQPRVSQELRVSRDRATTVTVELVPSPDFREFVTVTAPIHAHPPGVTTSSHWLANEEIRRAAGAFGDIQRFVQAQPGVAAVGDIRNDLVARGGSPTENLIRVDGFETPAISHFATVGASGGVVSLIDNELIADATFLAGGFPAEYGNRLSSVLDIRLREGNRTRPAVELDLNFAGASVIGEGPIGKRGSWMASGRRSFADLLANSAGVVSVPEMSAFAFKAAYDINQRHKLWAITFGGTDRVDFNLDDDDPDEPDFVGIEQQAWRWLTGIAWQHLLWNGAFGVLAVSDASAGYRIDARDRRLGVNSLILRDHSIEGATTVQYDVSWQAFDGWTLRGGIWHKRLRRDLDLAQPNGVRIPYSEAPREENPGLTLDFETGTAISASYVEASAQILPRTTLTGGVRFEAFEIPADTVTASPRGGIEVRVSPVLSVVASGGRYRQQPELVVVVAAPDNANLAPVEADHLVTGIRYEPRSELLVSAEVYRKWYRAYPVSRQYSVMTLANHGSEFNTSDLLLLPMVSAGRGRAHGLEVLVRKQAAQGLYGQIAYSLSRAEHAALDGIFRSGSYDTPHVLTLVGGTQIGGRWEVSGRFTYASGRPYTQPLLPASVDQNRLVYDTTRFNTERLPALHRLDIRVGRQVRLFGRNSLVFTDVQNLYNQRSVIGYEWNQKTRELHGERQLGVLPVVGINIEF